MTPPSIDKSPIWKVALLAFLSMCASDVFATVMVVEEARLNAPIAGSFDVLGYLATLVCSVLALDSILKDGWRNKRSLIIIGVVSLANFAGTYLGVGIGSLLTHH